VLAIWWLQAKPRILRGGHFFKVCLGENEDIAEVDNSEGEPWLRISSRKERIPRKPSLLDFVKYIFVRELCVLLSRLLHVVVSATYDAVHFILLKITTLREYDDALSFDSRWQIAIGWERKRKVGGRA
jgi:hypothetical protein